MYFTRKVLFYLYDLFSLRMWLKYFYAKKIKAILKENSQCSVSKETDLPDSELHETILQQKKRLNISANKRDKILQSYYRSSGSTGVACNIQRSKLEDAKVFAYAEALRSLHGFSARKPYIMIWGRSISVDEVNAVTEDPQSIFSFAHKFVSYSITENMVEKFVSAAETVKQVYGYAYSINDLCRRLQQRGYINENKYIFCLTSERVEPVVISNITRVFPNSKIIVEYGAIEFGVIGISDPRSQNPLHIFIPEIKYDYKIMRNRNLVLTHCKIGNVNFSEYLTGDCVGNTIKHTPNSITVNNISGRSAEIVKFQDVNLRQGTFHTILIYHIIWKLSSKEFSACISNNKINIQTSDKNLVNEQRKIQKILRERTNGIFEIEITFTNNVQRKKLQSGKQISVWSN